jgi:hypothetical protein
LQWAAGPCNAPPSRRQKSMSSPPPAFRKSADAHVPPPMSSSCTLHQRDQQFKWTVRAAGCWMDHRHMLPFHLVVVCPTAIFAVMAQGSDCSREGSSQKCNTPERRTPCRGPQDMTVMYPEAQHTDISNARNMHRYLMPPHLLPGVIVIRQCCRTCHKLCRIWVYWVC